MSCSRKWMSGPAQAWALLAMDRLRHIVALCFGPVTALRETLPPSAGRGMLSLDRPSSWMSPFPHEHENEPLSVPGMPAAKGASCIAPSDLERAQDFSAD